MRTLEKGTVIKCTRQNSRHSLVNEGEYYEVARHVHGSPIAWLMRTRTGATLCVSLDNEFEPVRATEFLSHQITEAVHAN